MRHKYVWHEGRLSGGAHVCVLGIHVGHWSLTAALTKGPPTHHPGLALSTGGSGGGTAGGAAPHARPFAPTPAGWGGVGALSDAGGAPKRER